MSVYLNILLDSDSMMKNIDTEELHVAAQTLIAQYEVDSNDDKQNHSEVNTVNPKKKNSAKPMSKPKPATRMKSCLYCEQSLNKLHVTEQTLTS